MSESEQLYDFNLFFILINPNIYLLLTLIAIVHARLFDSRKSEIKTLLFIWHIWLDFAVISSIF